MDSNNDNYEKNKGIFNKDVDYSEILKNTKKSSTTNKDGEELKDSRKEKDTNKFEAPPKKKKSKGIYFFYIIFIFIIFGLLGSINSSSRNTATTSSTSGNSSSNSVCSNWANSTASNAGQFTNILDNVVQDLNGYLDNSLSATDIATNFQNYTNRLEKLESNQKLLNPDSSNESSNKWFLMAIDNLINGVDYIGSGVETNYLPTLEAGVEFVEMATENIERATSRINSC